MLYETRPSDEDWRYELKMLCDGHMLSQARNWIRLAPENFHSAYSPRRVNNLYLDSLNNDNLNDNLSGVPERRKLRLRWYGPLEAERIRIPVLELKERRGYLGRKRRIEIGTDLDPAMLYDEFLRILTQRCATDWRLVTQITVSPTIINSYEREYFVSSDGKIRATLDYAQKAFDQRLCLRPNINRALPLQDTLIIEIKAAPDQSDRLDELMGHFPIQRGRNSKYVQGMLSSLF